MTMPYEGRVLESALWIMKNPGGRLLVVSPTEEDAKMFARDVAAEVSRLQSMIDTAVDEDRRRINGPSL